MCFYENFEFMTTINLDKPLTNLQIELLKLFAKDILEDKLVGLRDIISDYLLDITIEEADKVWEEKGYSEENVSGSSSG